MPHFKEKKSLRAAGCKAKRDLKPLFQALFIEICKMLMMAKQTQQASNKRIVVIVFETAALAWYYLLKFIVRQFRGQLGQLGLGNLFK
jgi:hypothetical protein